MTEEELREVFSRCEGKEIVKAGIWAWKGDKDDGCDRLDITFSDGSILRVWDDGQSCCEKRFLTCDDDLGFCAGGKFLGIEQRPVVEGGDREDCDVQEIGFLVVRTGYGEFTVCTHNEHNGYYDGFCVKAEVVTQEVRT